MSKTIDDMLKETERVTMLKSLSSIMETMDLTIFQAMDALKIPITEQTYYCSRLSEGNAPDKGSDYTKERQLIFANEKPDEFHKAAVAYGKANPL